MTSGINSANGPADHPRVVAAIDCGTNSIRLLIADVDPETGELSDRVRLMNVVRLGEGVDRTGRLAADALERTFDAARTYAALCREHEVSDLRFVATSATRDAANTGDFVRGIRDLLGVEPEVLSGLAEAELSFTGAVSALSPDRPAPYLTVDLGGGSTELVLGSDRPEYTASLDIGSVRLTERHMRTDPPTPLEVSSAVIDIDSALDAVADRLPFGRTGTLIGLAGSITTVTAHALRLPAYDRAAIDGTVLSAEEVLVACGELMHSTRAERAAFGYMHPGRVDIIGAGALIWSRIVARVRAEVTLSGRTLSGVVTSEHDMLDGIALSVAKRSSAG